MKYPLGNIRSLVFLERLQSAANARRLCSTVGFTNILACLNFYLWIIWGPTSGTLLRYSLAANILMHLYLNGVLIRWCLPYENARWMKWVWASLICVSPIGAMLIYTASREELWSEEKREGRRRSSAFHSLTNSSVSLEDILRGAIEYLTAHHGEDFNGLLRANGAGLENVDEWTDHAKCIVIALHEALKQSRRSNVGFRDLVFGAHWYDGRHFEFAVLDPKGKMVPNARYRYSFGFVVLDEVNNYRKIVERKREIKANMKYGPAKAVCLHWGKGFKIYVNE